MDAIAKETEVSRDNVQLEEKKVILLWSFTVWLVVMNTNMFNVALPAVLTELNLTSTSVSWIVSGYSIVFAMGTLTYSRLSDFLPIKRLLTIGIIIFTLASVLGFMSHNFYMLLTARIVQAAGSGAVGGLAMVLAGRYIPVERRGMAMAFISSAASLGFGLGPVAGGIVTEYLGWNYLFILTLVVILMLPAFHRLLPNEKVLHVKFDTLGAILTIITITGLLLFISTFSYVLLIISLIGGWYVWKHFHKVETPFIYPYLLKNKNFMMVSFIGFIAFMAHFSTLFLIPMMLSSMFQMDAAKIGLIIFPGAILSAIAAQFIGRLIDKLGNKPLLFGGNIFLLCSTLLFSFFSSISPYSVLVAYMFMSIGFSSLAASMSNEISRILPKKDIGTGMGIMQLFQFFGGAFGVTLSGLILGLLQGVSPALRYTNLFIVLSVCIIASFIVGINYFKNRLV